MNQPRPMRKVVKDGRVWCRVFDAARYLHTTQETIRRYMGTGELAYAQMRRNGDPYVSVTDLVALKTALEAKAASAQSARSKSR